MKITLIQLPKHEPFPILRFSGFKCLIECISSVFIIVMCSCYLLKYLLVSVEIDHILNLRYDLMIGFSPNKEKDYYTSHETELLFHLSNYFYFLTYCLS